MCSTNTNTNDFIVNQDAPMEQNNQYNLNTMITVITMIFKCNSIIETQTNKFNNYEYISHMEEQELQNLEVQQIQ